MSKAALLLATVALLSTRLFAQGGFEIALPVEKLGVGDLQVADDYVYAHGHWIASDEQSKLTGPSVSTITCDHREGTCTENQGNITVIGGIFTLSADSVEYKVERWNKKELVAANVGGACHIRNVLKFDFVQRRVFTMSTLSEPIDDKEPKLFRDMCRASAMNLELRAGVSWLKR
jgi:hypothetical protein